MTDPGFEPRFGPPFLLLLCSELWSFWHRVYWLKPVIFEVLPFSCVLVGYTNEWLILSKWDLQLWSTHIRKEHPSNSIWPSSSSVILPENSNVPRPSETGRNYLSEQSLNPETDKFHSEHTWGTETLRGRVFPQGPNVNVFGFVEWWESWTYRNVWNFLTHISSFHLSKNTSKNNCIYCRVNWNFNSWWVWKFESSIDPNSQQK